MIVRQQIHHIGIAAVEFDDHCRFIVSLDIDDTTHNCFGCRL